MRKSDLNNEMMVVAQARLGRRSFMRNAGLFSLSAAAAGLVMESKPAFAASEASPEVSGGPAQARDTVAEIFTAALIAEDLATTFYYNALTGAVIQDPNLAGPGGTATNVTSAGNFGNVAYVRAALTEEIAHANLFRSLLGMTDAANDPAQTFYFPAGSFDTLAGFTGLLDALENAFIGAYLNAIQEFAYKAAHRSLGIFAPGEEKYNQKDLEYFAKVAASIMGVESEHRVLGRVISNSNPANNLRYEQTDGLNAVYNGKKSAVAALTPFLTPSTGAGYSLASALANQGSVSEYVGGDVPAY